MISKNQLKKINDYLWEIPKSYRSDMRVPARIYASEKMLEDILEDESLIQAVNVAALAGIQKYSLAMPDIHEGYGFPIGGVAAIAIKTGVISPGGIGFDINCGVRLLKSEKTFSEVKDKLGELASEIYRQVPSGVGKGGRLKLKDKELDEVLKKGARKLVELGYGTGEDLEFLESQGELELGEPSLVSERAKHRGRDQLGTMGAGNHFVEVQRVDEILNKEIAETFGLFKNQITILIHTGSRGLGHQIAADYIKVMLKAMEKYDIKVPDRQLASAPFISLEGQNYFKAMACGANFAWANRQLISWEVREAWKKVLGPPAGGLEVMYDVAHNIAKLESSLLVHRKGATRAFPPNHLEIPEKYRPVGQPVIIPGSMGTASYVLAGGQGAMEQTFGSTCHGAGRRMSRTKAKREVRGSELKQELEKKGIVIRTDSISGLAEEAPSAYKDVEEVVEVVHNAGLAKKVARLKPLAVIKG